MKLCVEPQVASTQQHCVALWYVDNHLCPEGAEVIAKLLAKLTSLSSLDMCNTNITGEAAQSLAQAVLTHVSMQHFCRLPLSQLRQNALKELELEDVGIGLPGALVLCKVWESSCPGLSLLNLTGEVVICKLVQDMENWCLQMIFAMTAFRRQLLLHVLHRGMALKLLCFAVP